MLLYSLTGRPPTRQKHRLFRLVLGILGLVLIVLLGVQYMPYRLLPTNKTDTLWGGLVGMTTVAAFVEYAWAAASRRDSAG